MPLLFAAVALAVLSPWLLSLDSAILAIAFAVWFYLLGAYATLFIFAPLPLLLCWWRNWLSPWQIIAALALAALTAYIAAVLKRAAVVGATYWQWSSETIDTTVGAFAMIAVGAAHGFLLCFFGVRKNSAIERKLQNGSEAGVG
jgi:hypothetical protein